MALFGRHAEPAHCLGIVLEHTLTELRQDTPGTPRRLKTIYRAAVSADAPRSVRLATFYTSDQEDLDRTRLRGKVLRDTR